MLMGSSVWSDDVFKTSDGEQKEYWSLLGALQQTKYFGNSSCYHNQNFISTSEYQILMFTRLVNWLLKLHFDIGCRILSQHVTQV